MQLSDLAVEQLRDCRILVRLYPFLALPQIERDRRMDDTDVLAVDRRRVRLFQRGHGLVDLGRRQHARCVHAASFCHLGMFAGRGVHLVAELLHRAAHNLVSHHLVNAHAAGRAEFFGRAENRVVNRVQFQQI